MEEIINKRISDVVNNSSSTMEGGFEPEDSTSYRSKKRMLILFVSPYQRLLNVTDL